MLTSDEINQLRVSFENEYWKAAEQDERNLGYYLGYLAAIDRILCNKPWYTHMTVSGKVDNDDLVI